jgi:hypothetical protein
VARRISGPRAYFHHLLGLLPARTASTEASGPGRVRLNRPSSARHVDGSANSRPNSRWHAGRWSCSRSSPTQKTVRGDQSDGRRRAPGRGLLPGAGCVGIRLLPVVDRSTVRAGDPACLADRRDPSGPCRQSWRLRLSSCPCRTDARTRAGGRLPAGVTADAPGRPAGAFRSAPVAAGTEPAERFRSR